MKSIIFAGVCGFLLVNFATAQPGQECTKPNQVFSNCGSACQPSCRNLKPQICTMQCVIGCVCKSGFVKDDAGNCILSKDCPPISTTPAPSCTKPHQIYKTCGSSCGGTCRSMVERRMCTMQCVEGCFCEDGFLMNDQGNCVISSQCFASPGTPVTAPPLPPACKATEEFNNCGSACEPSCKVPEPPMCTEQCVQKCFCKGGLFRNDQGDCVARDQCPKADSTTTKQPSKRCGKNERWSNDTCVVPAFCQARCPNLPQRMCKVRCIQGGCVCRPGFYRDVNGDCITRGQCKRQGTTNGTPEPIVSGGTAGSDPCNPNPCTGRKTCRPDPKQCFAVPCPQYVCA